jgi:hypothetical protein
MLNILQINKLKIDFKYIDYILKKQLFLLLKKIEKEENICLSKYYE